MLASRIIFRRYVHPIRIGTLARYSSCQPPPVLPTKLAPSFVVSTLQPIHCILGLDRDDSSGSAEAPSLGCPLPGSAMWDVLIVAIDVETQSDCASAFQIATDRGSVFGISILDTRHIHELLADSPGARDPTNIIKTVQFHVGDSRYTRYKSRRFAHGTSQRIEYSDIAPKLDQLLMDRDVVFVFHNQDMDVGILRQFSFDVMKRSLLVFDTWRMAVHYGLPARLREIARHFRLPSKHAAVRSHVAGNDAYMTLNVFLQLAISDAGLSTPALFHDNAVVAMISQLARVASALKVPRLPPTLPGTRPAVVRQKLLVAGPCSLKEAIQSSSRHGDTQTLSEMLGRRRRKREDWATRELASTIKTMKCLSCGVFDAINEKETIHMECLLPRLSSWARVLHYEVKKLQRVASEQAVEEVFREAGVHHTFIMSLQERRRVLRYSMDMLEVLHRHVESLAKDHPTTDAGLTGDWPNPQRDISCLFCRQPSSSTHNAPRVPDAPLMPVSMLSPSGVFTTEAPSLCAG